ncbi:MAG: GNAT family N-acetyltransferase [Gemmatimonadota bacterium]|nr:GNAT family N-acetyltransferase [Gemmatimonadota bacterium]
MSRIGLVPFDEPMLAALAADAPAYAARDGISLGPNGGLLEGVAGQTLAYMQRTGSSAPWAGYLAIDLDDRLVVGTCAYKGPPDADGMVEVAYFTFPTCEGRGCATAMARTLRDQAAASGAVRLVRAHTLPERNASARILAKLDFVFVGEVIDPEDGCVWRWDWPVVPRVRATPNRVA